MRPTGYYVIAGLLVLASLPIYRYIYLRAARPDDPAPSSATASRAPTPVLPTRFVSLVQAEATAAMRAGRAKCVAGVVYRTADHVIEPWPGHVQCQGDQSAFTVVEVSGL